MEKTILAAFIALAVLLLSACAPAPLKMSELHIDADRKKIVGEVPAPILVHPDSGSSADKGAELANLSNEVYSVVVNNVDLRELLFALSRDAELDVDIASDVSGTVTLNAVDQGLFQILDRIVGLSDIRYTVKNGVLVIQKDGPYFVHYDVGYLNMGRSSQSNVSISTEVATTGVGAETDGSSGSGSGDNSSSTTIQNRSNNNFWQTLTQNIEAMLQGNSSTGSAFTSLAGQQLEASTEIGADNKNASSVIVNSESGLISVKASKKQHREIGIFLDRVLDGAKRQVLIEASIVEVNLNDSYQAGVDWSRLVQSGAGGVSFAQELIGANLGAPPVSTLTYTDTGKHDISATVKLLSEYGSAKVLSSPKLMVLNNQTALLKVVDNIVYFSINVEEDVQENFINRTFTSDIHTVPVGLVMSVTPHVSKVDEVILNVRPTISRVSRFVEDPNPALIDSDVESLIPEISVREMESMMKISGGDTAIIGGLMQDIHGDNSSGIPGLSKLPYIGSLFSYKSKDYSKSELIIFIRPVIIKQASLSADELAPYRTLLPQTISADFAE
ncbi:MAG: pilus (MSHA type) biogenesis protein MshL [Gammaproteobacteria bacterium]|nr:pilus (MSHA type) biogenesis protein MshL [Gammaproteobacteria bacterium]MBQ0838777.1 pilus (MSHA type) biogenesis protein MshL [Gammaproteobacteria bacterium]